MSEMSNDDKREVISRFLRFHMEAAEKAIQGIRDNAQHNYRNPYVQRQLEYWRNVRSALRWQQQSLNYAKTYQRIAGAL